MVKKSKKIVKTPKVKKVLAHGVDEFPNVDAAKLFLRGLDVGNVKNVQVVNNKYIVWYTHMIEVPTAVVPVVRKGTGNIR